MVRFGYTFSWGEINFNETLFHNPYILNACERNWHKVMADFDYTDIQYHDSNVFQLCQNNFFWLLK